MSDTPLGEQPGLIIIVSSDLARYSAFPASLLHLLRPPGSDFSWQIGLSPAAGVNDAIAAALGGRHMDWQTGARVPADYFQWFFILGDDHIVPPNTLALLLRHDLDIVVSICSKRRHPLLPVICTIPPDQLGPYTEWDELPFEGGLMRVEGAGNAGMLIRRSVVEAMAPPWFQVGQLGDSDALNEDAHFCLKATRAGFKIYVDTDVPIAHITPCAIWPKRTAKGWTVQLDYGGVRYTLDEAPTNRRPLPKES